MSLNLLITGANSGFGLLTAEKFARAGHTVHAGLRNASKGEALEALRAEGLPVIPVSLDVTDAGSIAAAVASAGSTAPIDVLVNNAGFEVRGPVETLEDDLLKRQFDTNVLGVVRLIRAVVPAMRVRGAGTIINVSSVAGHISAPFSGAYSASKHAVEALSEALGSNSARSASVSCSSSQAPSRPSLAPTSSTHRALTPPRPMLPSPPVSAPPWRDSAQARRNRQRRSPT